VARHRDHLSAALTVQEDTDTGQNLDVDGDDDPQSVPSDGPADRTDRWAMRVRERHAAVHTLLADGVALREICRQLGLSRGTVRRFARATVVEKLLARNGTGRRTSILEPFKPHLHRRWNEGCTNATALFAEITARGYRGGQNIVRQ
jgi:DNA-binding NarL/FixJ family response regulator